MRRALTLIAAAFLLNPSAALAQSSEQLFQQALVQERVHGNLDAAISLYEQVASDADDRSLAAQALIRIGQNYERMGAVNARSVYQRVISEFADQSDEVRLARNRMSILDQDPSDRSIRVARRHVLDVPDGMGDTSPNGRFLSLVHWDTGDYAILNTATGDVKLISSDGSWSDDTWAYGDVSYWSPDGRYVAYNWLSVEKDTPVSTPNGMNLRIYDTQTEETRTLASNEDTRVEDAWGFFPRGWTPDSRSIVAVTMDRDDRTHGLVLIDGASGAVQHLFEQPDIRSVAVAPDGEHVAYTVERAGPDGPAVHETFFSRIDGTGRTSLGARAHNLLFSDDGRYLFFVADSDTRPVIRAVEFEDGTPTGNSVLVAEDLPSRVKLTGFSTEGDLYFVATTAENRIMVQEVDLDSGSLRPNRRQLVYADADNQRSASMSPDGKRVAFVTVGQEERVGVYDIETGVVQLFDPIGVIQRPVYTNLRWTRDGESILVSLHDVQWQFVLMDAETGAVKRLFDEPLPVQSRLRSPAFTADGRMLLFAQNSDVYSIPTTGGRPERVRTFDGPIRGLAVDGDTDRLAVLTSDTVYAGDNVASAEPLDIEPATDLGFSHWIGVSWLGDDRLLLADNLTGLDPDERGQQLVIVDPDREIRTELGSPLLGDDQYPGFQLNPDGYSFLFQTFRNEVKLWRLENVMSELAD